MKTRQDRVRERERKQRFLFLTDKIWFISDQMEDMGRIAKKCAGEIELFSQARSRKTTREVKVR